MGLVIDMDLKKIGNFIAKCRKEKNLTQEQLGDILGMNRKTISKWENGNYAPDISLLEPLSETLDVSVHELLIGEKENDNVVDTTVDTIKYYNSKSKKKIISIFIFVLFLLLIAFGVYIYTSNYYNYKVSYLQTSEENIELNALIVHNKEKSFVIINDIFYNNSLVGTVDEIKVKDINIKLMYNDLLIQSKTADYSDITGGKKLNDALENLQFSYNLSKANDMPVIDNFEINNLHIVIEYTDINNKTNYLNINLYIY
jgi:transcriptional regulator with XRE-family HTH domain